MIRIIQKLWSAIYDLKMLIAGTGKKTMEDIDRNLDLIEYQCREYIVDDCIESMEYELNN